MFRYAYIVCLVLSAVFFTPTKCTVLLSKASVCGRSLAGIAGSNPAGVIDVCYECCVLSRSGMFDELITGPEESYRIWCAVVCDP